MIKTKKDLIFFIQADYMMNRGYFKRTLKKRFFHIFVKDHIMDYLVQLRKYEYFSNQRGAINRIKKELHHLRVKKLGEHLGFSIEPNVMGYGLVMPHYGTIVVGSGNVIGNYCVLHTSTCITAGKKVIGDSLYLSSGAKIIKPNVLLGKGISVSANAVIREDFYENNVLLAGNPAKKIKDTVPWYVRDGEVYKERVNACNILHDELYKE